MENGMMHKKDMGSGIGRKGMSHHQMMVKDYKQRMLVVLALSVPVLILSETIQKWFDITVPDFGFNTLLLVVFATGIVFYGGKPFFTGAVTSLKKRVLGMNVLVSLAVAAGYLFSLGTTFLFSAPDLYWEISTLVLFLLFGHWVEMRAVVGASGALGELVKLIPPMSHLVEKETIIDVPTTQVAVGDTLLIRPGERIPLDGVVIEGGSHVNEALMTGEARPVAKKEGDRLIGGSLNESGSLTMQVNQIGENTALAGIINLVKSAQLSKPRTQRIADRAAHYLTLTAIVVGTLTFGYWFGFTEAGPVFALTLAITVLVITCPHALGLAIPTVTSISTGLAAKAGMLIKDMNALEKAKDLDYVVFDKTGTLTAGNFGVTDVVSLSDWSSDTIIKNAAALEVRSEHSIARAIVDHTSTLKIPPMKVEQFVVIGGKGVFALASGEKRYVGNMALMNDLKLDVSDAVKKADKLTLQGKTVVFVADEREVKGVIALADVVREESLVAIADLRKQGVQVAMLTGDEENTARAVSAELKIERYFANVLPADKAGKIAELQKEGYKVAMVGDGVNDAPALTQADIGIAIGAGTDVAIESAEIVLVKNDPRDISRLMVLSQKTVSKMKQNLIWATGYNIIAIPIGAGVLFPYGITLTPEYAALIMATSSIIVVINAVSLRTTSLEVAS